MSQIKTSDARRYIDSVRAKLDAIAGGRTTVKASEVQGDPVLHDLAKDVFTGCGSMREVSVAKMKRALETIGESVQRVDREGDRDGKVDYQEAARLSALAVRMLDLAADRGVEALPRPAPPASTGCGSSTPAPPAPPPPAPVSTGCGGGSVAPVRSGCG